jgi:hypothetical protein
MVCFCKNTASDLAQVLGSLDVQDDPGASDDMQAVLSLGDWLTGVGQPAAPFVQDSSWLDLSLPVPSLSASAIATISAIATLRAQVMAQLGIDLLVPGQATAFVRLAATLATRLDAMASLNLSLGVGAWSKLAAVAKAASDVQQAISQGVFEPAPPSQDNAQWETFGSQLKPLLPLLSLSTQLGLNLSASFTAELSAMIGAIVKVQMPQLPVPAINLMATLSASLTAIAQLKLALGVDPIEAGFAEARAMVTAQVTAVAQSSGGLPDLLALLPELDVPPDLSFVTAANVSAAMSVNATALAALNWQVPSAVSLPVVSVGLPIASLSAQLSAAFGLSPSPRPCGGTCDAAALLSATLKV